MITHCVCLRKSFGYVKHIAQEKNLTDIREVMKETKCGTRCKKCVPYLQKMLETGETKFDGVLDVRKKPRIINPDGQLR